MTESESLVAGLIWEVHLAPRSSSQDHIEPLGLQAGKVCTWDEVGHLLAFGFDCETQSWMTLDILKGHLVTAGGDPSCLFSAVLTTQPL